MANFTDLTRDVKYVLQGIEATDEFDQLSQEELKVLAKIKPLKDGIVYTPRVLEFHWKIMIKEMKRHSEMLDNNSSYVIENYQKIDCFAYDPRSPSEVRVCAMELRSKYYHVLIERVKQKCENDQNVRVDDLTIQEQIVLDKQNLHRVNLSETAQRLHWEVAYHFLEIDMLKYGEGNMEPDERLHNKIKFFIKDETVPDYLKAKAKEFSALIS